MRVFRQGTVSRIQKRLLGRLAWGCPIIQQETKAQSVLQLEVRDLSFYNANPFAPDKQGRGSASLLRSLNINWKVFGAQLTFPTPLLSAVRIFLNFKNNYALLIHQHDSQRCWPMLLGPEPLAYWMHSGSLLCLVQLSGCFKFQTLLSVVVLWCLAQGLKAIVYRLTWPHQWII